MDLMGVIHSTFNKGFKEANWYNKVSDFDFSGMVTKSNKFYNPDNFNTPIPENRKVEYSNWAKLNVTDDGRDYDYAGAFLAGFGRDQSGNGHLPDTFKKPGHPTFPKSSKYATGEYAKFAGDWKQNSNKEWIFYPAAATLKAVNNKRKK